MVPSISVIQLFYWVEAASFLSQCFTSNKGWWVFLRFTPLHHSWGWSISSPRSILLLLHLFFFLLFCSSLLELHFARPAKPTDFQGIHVSTFKSIFTTKQLDKGWRPSPLLWLTQLSKKAFVFLTPLRYAKSLWYRYKIHQGQNHYFRYQRSYYHLQWALSKTNLLSALPCIKEICI